MSDCYRDTALRWPHRIEVAQQSENYGYTHVFHVSPESMDIPLTSRLKLSYVDELVLVVYQYIALQRLYIVVIGNGHLFDEMIELPWNKAVLPFVTHLARQ